MRKALKIFFSIGIVIFLLVIGFFYFLHFSPTFCKDSECYISSQVNCDKATFIKDTEDIVWSYEILGKEEGVCNVLVEILEVKKGDLDKRAFLDKLMICSLPLGSSGFPETKLNFCHGRLKEEIQDMIIKNLHSQIVENFEQINSEVLNPFD